jgi:hypothetical protein
LASALGAFAYTPTLGEILAAGTHTLTAVFTPADDAAHSTAEAKVLLTVTKATPSVMWPAPVPVVYGTPLSADQLNATASVPGAFVYTPAAGEVLTAGTRTLSATFTPADSTNYETVYAIVPLMVTKAESAITWPKPASIAYGTALGAMQLNATASIPGTFVYTPAAGQVLTAGLQTLSVTFTPSDSTDFNQAKTTVPLMVTRATPIITWPAPEAISFGTALSTSQLNASALVPGSFLYSPAAGEVLEAGTHALSVSFTPADAAAYTTVQATVSLTVAEAKPAAAWPAPTSAPHDAVISAAIQSSAQSQPESAETSPAEAEKASIQASPVARKTAARLVSTPPVNAPHTPSAKAPVKPPVESAHKHLAKVQVNPPAESADEVPAIPPVETPAKSLVRVLGPKSVIDVGPGLDLMGSAVFQDGTTIYLVMQPGSGGPQDSSRMVSQFFANGGPKPEILINRIEPRTQGVAPGQASTALARMAYSPISRLIGQMARPATDVPATPEKATGFSLKALGRKLWSKISTNEKAQSITQLGLADDGDREGASAREAQPGVAANFPRRPVYAAPAAPVFAAGMPIPNMPVDTAGRTDFIDGELGRQSASASNLHGEPEARTYKGAHYVKGADGQWHLQKSQNSLREMKMEAQATAHFSEPAPKTEAAPEKAPAKRVTKAAAKLAAKASAKKVVKSAAKSTTKISANPKAKTAVKAPVKASATRVVETAAKPAAKTSAKRVVKVKAAAARPSAKSPAQKPVSTKLKPVPASSPKPAKAVKLSRPTVNKPSGGVVPESPVSKLTPEPALQKPDSEILVNMPVSESPQES